jgi:hypothetical protein
VLGWIGDRRHRAAGYSLSCDPSRLHTPRTFEDNCTGDSFPKKTSRCLGERLIRQRLLAHSDRDRFYSYEFCDPIPFPVRNFEATQRLTPIVDGNKAFVEWWATFDCAADEYDRWIEFYRNSFAKWLESLRAVLTKT